jgi:hypothetical protein
MSSEPESVFLVHCRAAGSVIVPVVLPTLDMAFYPFPQRGLAPFLRFRTAAYRSPFRCEHGDTRAGQLAPICDCAQ